MRCGGGNHIHCSSNDANDCFWGLCGASGEITVTSGRENWENGGSDPRVISTCPGWEDANGDAACELLDCSASKKCPAGSYCPAQYGHAGCAALSCVNACLTGCAGGTCACDATLDEAACGTASGAWCAKTIFECGPGTFCPAGSAAPVPCVAGTWSDAYGRSEPCDQECEAGYHCPSRSVTSRGATCESSGVLLQACLWETEAWLSRFLATVDALFYEDGSLAHQRDGFTGHYFALYQHLGIDHGDVLDPGVINMRSFKSGKAKFWEYSGYYIDLTTGRLESFTVGALSQLAMVALAKTLATGKSVTPCGWEALSARASCRMPMATSSR